MVHLHKQPRHRDPCNKHQNVQKRKSPQHSAKARKIEHLGPIWAKCWVRFAACCPMLPANLNPKPAQPLQHQAHSTLNHATLTITRTAYPYMHAGPDVFEAVLNFAAVSSEPGAMVGNWVPGNFACGSGFGVRVPLRGSEMRLKFCGLMQEFGPIKSETNF